MEKRYHRVADVSIEDSITRIMNVEGIEGTEDLIHRVLVHPDLAQMKQMFLDAYHDRLKTILK